MNRYKNILCYFLILFLIYKLSFLILNSFIVYYNNVILLYKLLKLFLIIKKSFKIIIYRKNLMKKMKLRK